MPKHQQAIFLITTLLVLLMPLSVHAIAPIVPACAREQAETQTPGLECVVFAMINVAKLILGISGSVALALFIYGGFLMLVSGGNEQLVTKGKSILSGAVIGLIIVFGAYTGVFFLVKTLTQSSEEAAGLLECIDLDTGSAKPSSEACGPDDQGFCQSGVCVTTAGRAPLAEGTGCCLIQTAPGEFSCQGEMSQEDCTSIPENIGITSGQSCDTVRTAGQCQ